MKDFTIVTAISKKYLDKAKLTIPSWKLKPQFANQKLVIFYSGLEEKDIRFSDKNFDTTYIKWDMPKYDSTRELMLSSFVLGTAKHITSEYWVKIDCDVLFTSSEDIFKEEHFGYDLFSRRWGYTKPAIWLKQLDEWSSQNVIPGNNLFDGVEMNKETHGHKRIISSICLHKSEFVRKAASYTNDRLPVPSHDTFLWYMAERLPNISWGSERIMHGAVTRKHLSSLQEEMKPVKKSVFPYKKIHGDEERLVRKYKFRSQENIFNKVQLEITTDCNVKCINCDRSCRQAPSVEEMSVSQIKGFVDESLELNWVWDRIDILGGEPTMHTDLEGVFKEIHRYKKKSPRCKVRFSTNGFGTKVNSQLRLVPDWVSIRNSSKKSSNQKHSNYNAAPLDFGIKDAPYCDIPWRCGLGLSKYGYYPCGAGASVDRVVGMDVGIKSLKNVNTEGLSGQLKKLCCWCGHSLTKNKHRTNKEEKSPSWEKAYEDYKKNPPNMTSIYKTT